MLPIVLNPNGLVVGLAGRAEPLARRRAMLQDAGIEPVEIPPQAALPDIGLLFVAGLDDAQSQALAAQARARNIPVNVEDVPALCDFHVPAIVRRGDLLLTISTGGTAPGLSKLIREKMEKLFGPVWENHLQAIGRARKGWRSDGLAPPDISRRTRDLVREMDVFK